MVARRIGPFIIVTLLLISAGAWAGGKAEAPAAQKQQSQGFDWKQAAGAKIAVAMNLNGEAENLEKALPKFIELTGIQVDYQLYPELELHQKTLVDFASKTGQYDVVQQDFMFTPQYAKADFTVPLDQFIDNPKYCDKAWYKPGDFLGGMWKAVLFNGKPYAIPFAGESSVLMYREDLFKEKGLKAPASFDDIWAAAKALNNPPNIYGIAMRGQRGQGMNIYIWTSFFRGFGGKFFKDYPNDMTPTLDTPEAIKATEYFAGILRNYGPPGVANWTFAEVYAAQQQGQVAMALDANNFGTVIDLPEKSKTAGKWGYVVLGGKNMPQPSIYEHVLSVNNYSKNKVAAWLFTMWATGPEMVLERGIATGSPTRESAWMSPELGKGVEFIGHGSYPKVTAASMNIADPQFRPMFPHWREMGDILGAEVQEVIAGGKDAAAAMKSAQQEIENMLRKNGYIK
jgi:multiple sugar transport system substrate-binding protein